MGWLKLDLNSGVQQYGAAVAIYRPDIEGSAPSDTEIFEGRRARGGKGGATIPTLGAATPAAGVASPNNGGKGVRNVDTLGHRDRSDRTAVFVAGTEPAPSALAFRWGQQRGGCVGPHRGWYQCVVIGPTASGRM